MRTIILLVVLFSTAASSGRGQVVTSPAPLWVKKIVDMKKKLKWYNWRDKFAIASTYNVDDTHYQTALNKVNAMIGHRDDILNQLKANNHILLLIADNENTSDFKCYAPFPDTYGYGGTLAIPVSSIKTINFGWQSGAGVYREDIMIHEFAHGIHLCGLNNSTFDAQLQTTFTNSKAKWINTYAYTNKEEYWAEITQSYFNVNYEGPVGGDGVHNNINTKDELFQYDRAGYDLCYSVYTATAVQALAATATTAPAGAAEEKPFMLFPNPAKSESLKISHDLGDKIDVFFYSPSGDVVKHIRGFSGKDIDTSGIGAGTYIVRIFDGSSSRFCRWRKTTD